MSKLDAMLHEEFGKHVLFHEEKYFEKLVAFINERCSIRDKEILEFGCGIGDLSLSILQERAKSILGIDISESSIQEAKKRALKANARAANFCCGNILEMENVSIKPDIIISHSVIHYIPGDLYPVLHRLFSILKNGGTLFATVEVTKSFNVVRMLQRFLFFASPEFLKKNLHVLFRLILALINKEPLGSENKLILKNKARYLAIPVFQVKTKEDWVDEFERAGFSDVSIEMAPKLNKLSSPHYFIRAIKSDTDLI